MDLKQMALNAREAAWSLAALDAKTRNGALLAMAGMLQAEKPSVFAANEADLAQAKAENLAAPLLSRLTFGWEKLAQTVRGLEALAKLRILSSYSDRTCIF